MIRSMTAYGAGRAESDLGVITIEVRTVNSRFLDANLRLPDDFRVTETALREKLAKTVKRGKAELRLQYAANQPDGPGRLDTAYLVALAEQLQAARLIMPDTQPPSLFEMLKQTNSAGSSALDIDAWLPLCLEACNQALTELDANRLREGQRLAAEMQACATQIAELVEQVEAHMPALLQAHQNKVTQRLTEALQSANPEGFAQIGAAELSARLAQEASLFAMRADVAEELARLRSHIAELQHLLAPASGSPASHSQQVAQNSPATATQKTGKSRTTAGSIGKRLDFLFQEMNREANTLGSKAAEISVTRAAIDLKLLIEQLREQAQNIE